MAVQSPENPLVSIIVPSYNQGRFIRKTLQSILSQDYRPLEIIVVDGISTDETVAVLHEFDGVPEVKWISEPDKGVVDAVNKGFARATGELCGIQSSDDYYLPGAIGAAVAALKADPSLGFVYGDCMKVDAEGRELSRTHLLPYSLEGLLSVRFWVPQPSTFFRLDLARKLGGWRDSVPYAADTDLWFRMAFIAPAYKIEEVIAVHRVHDAQRDKQNDRIVRDFRRMLSELAPLTHAPAGLRRAALAGQLRNLARYKPSKSYWQSWWISLRCVVLHPPLLQDVGWQPLLPGWLPLRGYLVRLGSRWRQRSS